jgi:preprotein translocase subunit YajC
LNLGSLQNLILPIALLALMYFMMIRPQQQQAKKRQEMLSKLNVGSDVVTIGGLHGTITAMDDKTVRLRVASNVELTFNRSAIGAAQETK